MRETAVERELGMLAARRQLADGGGEGAKEPPVKEDVEHKDGEDAEESQRRRRLRELRDVGRDVVQRGRDAIGDAECADARGGGAEGRSHDAVAQADDEEEEAGDRLFGGRGEHAEHDRDDAARAAGVEEVVVTVPGDRLEPAKQNDTADVDLQRQQQRAVPHAQPDPESQKRGVEGGHGAEEGEEGVQLRREVAVRVEPRGRPRNKHAARRGRAARQQQIVHARA
mmetsp:Transcript_20871/g.65325  ORF Transcript_20871/g.65325 Transcript_20871/m.65325 type:complete len:226 (-) Transcript_20871:452-1129(-)